MRIRSIVGKAALVLGVIAVASCVHGPVKDVDAAVDCRDTCDRYKDCFDSSYDTAACRSRCRVNYEGNPRTANECDTCLDGRSCAEATACFPACKGILI